MVDIIFMGLGAIICLLVSGIFIGSAENESRIAGILLGIIGTVLIIGLYTRATNSYEISTGDTIELESVYIEGGDTTKTYKIIKNGSNK